MPKGVKIGEDQVLIGGKVYRLGPEDFPGSGRPILFEAPAVRAGMLVSKLIQIVVEEEEDPAPLFPLAKVTVYAINADRRPVFMARLIEPFTDRMDKEYAGYSSSLRQVVFQSVTPGWEPQLMVHMPGSSEGIMAELFVPTIFLGVLPDRPMSTRELESYSDLEHMVRVEPQLLRLHGFVNLGFGVFQVFEEGVGFRREWPETRWKGALKLREQQLKMEKKDQG